MTPQTPRTLESYAKHDLGCSKQYCAFPLCAFNELDRSPHYGGTVTLHDYSHQPCSCGLDALLALRVVEGQEEQKKP